MPRPKRSPLEADGRHDRPPRAKPPSPGPMPGAMPVPDEPQVTESLQACAEEAQLISAGKRCTAAELASATAAGSPEAAKTSSSSDTCSVSSETASGASSSSDASPPDGLGPRPAYLPQMVKFPLLHETMTMASASAMAVTGNQESAKRSIEDWKNESVVGSTIMLGATAAMGGEQHEIDGYARGLRRAVGKAALGGGVFRDVPVFHELATTGDALADITGDGDFVSAAKRFEEYNETSFFATGGRMAICNSAGDADEAERLQPKFERAGQKAVVRGATATATVAVAVGTFGMALPVSMSLIVANSVVTDVGAAAVEDMLEKGETTAVKEFTDDVKNGVDNVTGAMDKGLTEGFGEHWIETREGTKKNFENVGKEIERAAGETAEKIGPVLENAGKQLEEVGKGFEEVGKGFEEVGKGFEEVGKGFEEVRENAGKQLEEVGKGFEEVGRKFEEVGKGIEEVTDNFAKGFEAHSDEQQNPDVHVPDPRSPVSPNSVPPDFAAGSPPSTRSAHRDWNSAAGIKSMPGDEELVVPPEGGLKLAAPPPGNPRFVIPPPGNPKLAVPPPGNPKLAVDVTDRDQNWLEAIKPPTWPWEQKSQQDAAKKDKEDLAADEVGSSTAAAPPDSREQKPKGWLPPAPQTLGAPYLAGTRGF